MDVLSYPFRLGAGGSMATVEDGSTDANAERIAVLALTRKGERALVPTFGTTDPVYSDLDVAELNACLATFGPAGVTVTGIDSTPTGERTATAVLTFEETPRG